MVTFISSRFPRVKLFSRLMTLLMVRWIASQWRCRRYGFLRLVMTGMPCLKSMTFSFNLGTTSLWGKPMHFQIIENTDDAEKCANPIIIYKYTCIPTHSCTCECMCTHTLEYALWKYVFMHAHACLYVNVWACIFEFTFIIIPLFRFVLFSSMNLVCLVNTLSCIKTYWDFLNSTV